PSFDFCGSSTKPASSVTILCSSVNRTSSGFCSGNLSDNISPKSSDESHVNSAAIRPHSGFSIFNQKSLIQQFLSDALRSHNSDSMQESPPPLHPAYRSRLGIPIAN